MDFKILKRGKNNNRGGGKKKKKKKRKRGKTERPFFLFSIGFKNKGADLFLSSKKIIFRTPFFCILIFKKAFKKHKRKTLRDWNFLGVNPVLRGDKSHTVHRYFSTCPSTIAGGVSRGGRAIHQRAPLSSPFVSTESPSNPSKGARYVFNLPTLYSCVIQWFEVIALLGICWAFCWIFISFFSLNVKALLSCEQWIKLVCNRRKLCVDNWLSNERKLKENSGVKSCMWLLKSWAYALKTCEKT